MRTVAFFSCPARPTNTPPIALDDSAELVERSVPALNVLANDSDADGDPLSVVSHTAAAHGELLVAADGRFLYRPEDGFVGTDTFEYVVSDGRGGTDTGNVTLIVPEGWFGPRFWVALSVADAYTATAEMPLVVDAASGVLANDVSLVSIDRAFVWEEPTKGTLVLNGDGSFVYTPDPGATGTDTFVYSAFSGGTGSDPTTVTITIEEAVAVETVVLGPPSERVDHDGGVLALVDFDLKLGWERTSDTVTFDWNGRDVSINTVGQLVAFVARIEHDCDPATDAIFDGDDLALVLARSADGGITEAIIFDGIVGEKLITERVLAALGADRANTTDGETDSIGVYFESDLALA